MNENCVGLESTHKNLPKIVQVYSVHRTAYAHKIYRKKYDCLCFIKIVLLLFVLCFGFFFFVNSLITIYFCAESQPFQVDYLE